MSEDFLRRTYKYRLYPTKKQAEMLLWTLDRCRELYNAALLERRAAWKMCKVSINYHDQRAQLPEIKQIREEYQSISAQVLQDVLRRVDKVYEAFFRRVKNGEKPGYPRFRKENRYDSFTYPQVEGRAIHLANNKITLPKIGAIKVKIHRKMQGIIKTCTIKREGQHWYVCFSCRIEAQDCRRTPYTDDAIGIDLGLLHFATLSTGDTIENPRYAQKSANRLVKAQRTLSRKKRGSNRRKKAVQRVSKAYRKVRNQRQDFLHKQSRQLVNTYEVIVLEDLAPSKMSRRPKPKQDEETGQYLHNGASQKAGLNKSILDAGWSTFVSLCEFKAAWAGTQVVKVDPYKTSQVCSSCGVEGPHKDLSIRTHACEHCGVTLDRDHNAAINILNTWLGRSLRKPKRVRSAKGLCEASGAS